MSLFKDYKFDSPKLYMECFEFDWKHCKIPNMIRNEDDLNSVKEILRSVYV